MTTQQRRAQAAAILLNSREDDTTPKPGTTARRTQPIRVPVYFPPELHRKFKQWALDQTESFDLADVPLTAAIRALIRLVITDPDLTNRVISEIIKEQ